MLMCKFTNETKNNYFTIDPKTSYFSTIYGPFKYPSPNALLELETKRSHKLK